MRTCVCVCMCVWVRMCMCMRTSTRTDSHVLVVGSGHPALCFEVSGTPLSLEGEAPWFQGKSQGQGGEWGLRVRG